MTFILIGKNGIKMKRPESDYFWRKLKVNFNEPIVTSESDAAFKAGAPTMNLVLMFVFMFAIPIRKNYIIYITELIMAIIFICVITGLSVENNHRAE